MNTTTDYPPRFERCGLKTTTLHTSQWLPDSIEKIFEFFSNPENLERLTPSKLQFQMLTPTPVEMKEGLELEYKLKVHNIPLRWTSLITNWDPPNQFVDEQLKGPYKSWVHTHKFTPCGSGTQVEDHVQFRVPGGRLLEKLIVQKDLASVFNYRQQLLTEIFPGE